MPRHRAVRRSPAQWAGRLALATFLALGGGAALAFSLAQVVAARNPALAYKLAPYDGQIAGRLAASLAGPEATPADRARADVLARDALRHDPTMVPAVSTLGINAQIRGDTALARRLFAYAQRLSRRDLMTQLWAIEDAVGRGDIAGALRQYDITLRAKPSLSDTLFPVLVVASSTNLQIRAALLRTLALRPLWGERYVTYAAASGRGPLATAALLTDLRRIGVATPEGAQVDVVNSLLAAGSFDQAWSYYATIRRGIDRRRSRDPGLAGVTTPTQLDWVAVNDNGIASTVQDGIIDFTVSASIGGPLVRQLQLLPPGDYRLAGHGDGIDQVAGAQPYWLLTCLDGHELGRIEMPASGRDGGRFSGSFNVPPGCPSQMLSLIARASDAASGVSGRIDRVELAPTR